MQFKSFQHCFLLILTFLAFFAHAVEKPTNEKRFQRSAKGATGMGLAGIADWSTQFPFIDLMKQSRAWRDWSNNVEGFDVDEHGWLKSLKPRQAAGTVFLAIDEGKALTFDRVHVFYEGEGLLEYGWSARKDRKASKAGRDVVGINPGESLLTIKKTNPKNPIRNIRIIPEPYLAAYEQGEIFNPQWLPVIDDFQALRFMDWMQTNHSKQRQWKDRAQVGDRTWQSEKGVPVEIMLQLANKLKADPWFNIPHLADANYMAAFAKLVKATLDPSLTLYIEHSNEVWNWGFEQAQYANKASHKRWGDIGDGFMQWHGMRTAKMCDIFKNNVFKDQTKRVKCVLGVHTGWRDLQVSAMECPKWVEEGNAPCYQHGFDYLGITTYFDGGLNGPPLGEDNPKQVAALQSWMKEKDGGLNLAFEQLENGKHLREVPGYENYRGVYHETKDKMDYWVAYAKKHNLGVVAYEGGQHISANHLQMHDDKSIAKFHLAINRDPRMEKVYREFLRAWKAGGGDLHMHFVDLGTPSKHGSWGSLEHLNQKTSPQWRAITDFNDNVPCWWEGCKGVNSQPATQPPLK